LMWILEPAFEAWVCLIFLIKFDLTFACCKY